MGRCLLGIPFGWRRGIGGYENPLRRGDEGEDSPLEADASATGLSGRGELAGYPA